MTQSLLTALLASLAVCAPMAQAADVATKPAAPLVSHAGLIVSSTDIDVETRVLDPQIRARSLANPAAVRELATDLFLRRTLAASPEALQLAERPEVAQALQLARERVLSDALLQQAQDKALTTPAVIEQVARNAYKAMPERFKHPEQVKVSHILIPGTTPNAKGTAQALRDQLLQGADFASLAKTQSKDPGSASKGGDLGFFSRGRMLKPFEDAAFALQKKGDLSDVIETRFGYHILKLDDKRPPGTQPFEEVKETLEKEAVAKLTQDARQKVADGVLQGVTPDLAAIEAYSAAYR